MKLVPMFQENYRVRSMPQLKQVYLPVNNRGMIEKRHTETPLSMFSKVVTNIADKLNEYEDLDVKFIRMILIVTVLRS